MGRGAITTTASQLFTPGVRSGTRTVRLSPAEQAQAELAKHEEMLNQALDLLAQVAAKNLFAGVGAAQQVAPLAIAVLSQLAELIGLDGSFCLSAGAPPLRSWEVISTRAVNYCRDGYKRPLSSWPAGDRVVHQI
jgi:hypothetical protein